MTTHSIEIDQEVFQALQRRARPFLDTPNDVLRQLLLTALPTPKTPAAAPPATLRDHMNTEALLSVDADSFVREVVAKEFGAGFRRRAPYRMMYEDGDRLVYFQNFSKEANHLWYRITKNPWKDLRSGRKTSFVCFTNPVERYVYLIPVADIKERVQRAGWSRDYLEVNIDPASSRWTELDWDLSGYRKVLGRPA